MRCAAQFSAPIQAQRCIYGADLKSSELVGVSYEQIDVNYGVAGNGRAERMCIDECR